jgi:glycerate kinase
VRILVAPQEFKGTLTAIEAAEAIADGIRKALPDAILDVLPMADGGPGTLDALLASVGGERRSTMVEDPLLRPVPAAWGVLADGSAVVECAAASGLWRLAAEERDARRASSYGTGQLIVAALEAGCSSIYVGLGGSATNDGGAGMAGALGYRFLDANGRDLEPGGAALARLHSIDTSDAHAGLQDARVLAATDVRSPLLGREGASSVFGPQKGASARDVEELDAALTRFADVVEATYGIKARDIAGAGSAGGLGFGLVAFTGAQLVSGADLVARLSRLHERVAAVDVVVTGEGRLDAQTGFGKGPAYVAQVCRRLGKLCVCIAGQLAPETEGIAALFSDIELSGSDEPPGAEARTLVVEAAWRVAGRLDLLVQGAS